MTFKEHHWALLDLEYSYLDDGFQLVAYTDVPCHLFCRMTTKPPLKHSKPTWRRGLALMGDIRFCFVVYEDNEQNEAGDTYIHTWNKAAWPVCETRWFYFVGNIAGVGSVSESPIFEFHFPSPPPEPPAPIQRLIIAGADNRSVYHTGGFWPVVHDTNFGTIHPTWAPPTNRLYAGDILTASYFIYRGFLAFNTYTIPATAIITSVILHFYVYLASANFLGRPNLCLTEGVQPIPVTGFAYGDQLPHTTVYGTRDLNSLVPGQYNQLTFEPSGYTLIKPGGLTKLCLRGQRDVEDFIYIMVSNNWCWFASQQGGVGKRPYLEVNYYPA